ncbi:MAG: class I SAM-dependent methyltransferase [Wenzhouxiangellaceae bacterium]
MPDIVDYNQHAWDQLVARDNEWTRPVSPEQIAAARAGEWQIVLTPQRPVPAAWLQPVQGRRILCLAGAGGQQGPILAAAGADVTVYDLSPAQLAQDCMVAERDGLSLNTVQGDMRDLSAFADEQFDVIVHPCSNCYVPELSTVWSEAARVLRPGGYLLSGLTNPASFIFDETEAEQGRLVVRHRLPYSDENNLTSAELEKLRSADEPLMFSHSLEDLIAGQLRAGLRLLDLYEDTWPGTALAKYMPAYFATLSEKA